MLDTAIERIDLLGLPLTPTVNEQTVRELLGKKGTLRLITFINPDAWPLSQRYPEYLAALQGMTCNLTNNMEVAWVCQWLARVRCFCFRPDTDLMAALLLKAAATEDAPVMLVGGRPGVDEGMRDKILSRYHGLKILNTLHAYGDFEPKVTEVLSLSPDLVLIDMGSPRQELFMLALSNAGYRGMAMACKGYFHRYLTEGNYYPHWVERLKLHSLWRLYKEPSQARNRYISDYCSFIVQAAKALTGKGKVF